MSVWLWPNHRYPIRLDRSITGFVQATNGIAWPPYWRLLNDARRPSLTIKAMADGEAKKRFPTRGPQCYAINCYNYKNELSKAKGITFHK